MMTRMNIQYVDLVSMRKSIVRFQEAIDNCHIACTHLHSPG